MSLNIGDLRGIIEDTIAEAMVGEVYDKVVKQLCDSATERIYNAYDPKDYHRRKTFEKEDAYTFDTDGPMNMIIKADAEFNSAGNVEANSGNLAELIYYGDGGNGHTYGWMPPKDREPTYLYPRPWIDDARNKIEESGVFKKAVVNALRSKGFKVR